MKENKLVILLIICTALWFIGIFVISIFYMSRKVPNTTINSASKTVLLSDNQELKSSFISYLENINLLEIRLKNPESRNNSKYEFSIYDEKGNLLRTIFFSGSNIPNDDWVKMKFGNIENAYGKEFFIVLKTDGSDTSNPVFAYLNENGDLNFKSFSQVSYGEALLGIFGPFLQRFIFDRHFSLFYIFLLSGCILSLIINNVKPAK